MGRHFPSREPRWRGVASRVFLEEVAPARGRGRLLAREPRRHGHRPGAGPGAPPRADARRHRRACSGSRPGQVSVKAKSTDHLGALGRGEGIAALATVLLEKGTLTHRHEPHLRHQPRVRGARRGHAPLRPPAHREGPPQPEALRCHPPRDPARHPAALRDARDARPDGRRRAPPGHHRGRLREAGPLAREPPRDGPRPGAPRRPRRRRGPAQPGRDPAHRRGGGRRRRRCCPSGTAPGSRRPWPARPPARSSTCRWRASATSCRRSRRSRRAASGWWASTRPAPSAGTRWTSPARWPSSSAARGAASGASCASTATTSSRSRTSATSARSTSRWPPASRSTRPCASGARCRAGCARSRRGPPRRRSIVGPAPDDDEHDPGARPMPPPSAHEPGGEDEEPTAPVTHVDPHDDVAWGQGPTVLKPVGFTRRAAARRPARNKGRRRPGGGPRRPPRQRPLGAASRGAPGPRPGPRPGAAARAIPARAARGAQRRRGRRERRRGHGAGQGRARPEPAAPAGAPSGRRSAAGRGRVPLGRATANGPAVRRPPPASPRRAAERCRLHSLDPFATLTVCRWRSSAVERLICNQRVGGSIPSASSSRRRSRAGGGPRGRTRARRATSAGR